MTTDASDVVRALRERLAALQHTGPVAAPDMPRPAGYARDRTDDPPPAAPPRDDHSGADPADRPASGVDPTGENPSEEERAEEERAEEARARNICLRLLADSARPRAGLAQKLAQRGISDAVSERVLDRFTEVGLIDDQAYAEAYVRSKHQERALSRRALTAELRRKGVDDAVVATATGAVDADDEEAAAITLITKRAPAALAAGPDAARRRLLALLDRRGYPADLSIRVVDGVLRRQDE